MIFETLMLLAVAVFGGLFGTLVGGQSLVTAPVLILLGLPAQIAVATNRVGIVGVPLAGWYQFHRQGKIDYFLGSILAIAAVIGSVFGALLVLRLTGPILEKVIGVITIVILCLIMAKPEVGLKHVKRKTGWKEILFGFAVSFFIGVYGGFYGAGIGTFFSYLLILLFGQTFLESAATNKIAISLLSLVAASIFFWNGLVDYYFAFVLFIGSFAGSWIGARYASRIGNVWIKRVFVTVVVLLGLQLLL